MSLEMPVSDWMNSGMCMPGLTRLLHSRTPSASTSMMPTSVMRSCAAAPPVVSRSTNARRGKLERDGEKDKAIDEGKGMKERECFVAVVCKNSMRGNASTCNSSHGNMHSVQLCVFAHRAMTMPHSHLSGNIAISKDERHASRMHSFSETVSLIVATGMLDLRKRPNYLCYLNPACRQHFYCRSTCIE